MNLTIQVMSDLHLVHHAPSELEPFLKTLKPAGVDLLVLAGDITTFSKWYLMKEHFEAFTGMYPQVLFVPGNHEYYGNDGIKGADAMARLRATFPTLHILSPGSEEHWKYELKGQRFVGGTGWFSSKYPFWMRRQFSDFRCIDMAADLAEQEYQDFIASSQRWLPSDVVVSHHMAHEAAVAPQYKGDAFNHFFVMDCGQEIIQRVAPKLWVHGHTHVSFDGVVGNTRIVCNPRGYPREHDAGPFNPDLRIEL